MSYFVTYSLMLIEWAYKSVLKKLDISHFATTKQIMLRLRKKIHQCYTYSNCIIVTFLPCLLLSGSKVLLTICIVFALESIL